MTRKEKGLIIDELKDKIKKSDYFYITDPQGMNVKQINAFRKVCFKANLEYKLYKNNLIKKALQDLDGDFSELVQVLKGFSAILFSPKSPNLPAKILKKYRKDQELDQPFLKAASISSIFYIGEDQLDNLLKIKSKNELIADIITILQSPIKNVVSALQSGQNTITGILSTLAEKDET